MKIERFEDVEAWKAGRDLVTVVCGSFSGCKDWGFRDQIQRAAVSVMSNVAEGFESGSNREYARYLTIARASAAEVKSLSYAALDLAYIAEADRRRIQDLCDRASGLINGFLKYLKNTDRTR